MDRKLEMEFNLMIFRPIVKLTSVNINFSTPKRLTSTFSLSNKICCTLKCNLSQILFPLLFPYTFHSLFILP